MKFHRDIIEGTCPKSTTDIEKRKKFYNRKNKIFYSQNFSALIKTGVIFFTLLDKLSLKQFSSILSYVIFLFFMQIF